jgi:hypothetical protein
MMAALRAQAQAAAAQRFPYLFRQTLWKTLRSTERQIKKIELMVEYLVACGFQASQ